MPPTRPGQRVLDKAAQHEREQRILAAQARREAGLLKSKNVSIEGDVPEAVEEVEKDRMPTMLELLERHKYVGVPLRMVKAYQEKQRQAREAVAAREAKRVWDMINLLEPGMRVKLVKVGRVGGKKFDGQLATVIGDVGNRYAVRLDLIDPDGTVHPGQGVEIKVGANNMEIYDEEVEQQLAEAEMDAKIAAQEARKELFRDIRAGNWKKVLGTEHDSLLNNQDDKKKETIDDDVVIEFEALSEMSTSEELRHFHKQKRMKSWLGKHDTPEEIYEKIKEEWDRRLACIKKFNRSLMDAEAAINVGMQVPSVRDDFRHFILNPAFAIARIGLKDARTQLSELLSRELTKGVLTSGNAEMVTLSRVPSNPEIVVEMKESDFGHMACFPNELPPKRGGPVLLEKVYDGKAILFTGGMAAGQYGVIEHYFPTNPITGDGPPECKILQWYTATPDKTTKYRILNAQYGELHVKGRAQKGDTTSITLSEDADDMKNSYQGMLVKITKGPGKSQRAKILAYDGETKQCMVDEWIWDKSLLEKALDQDDDNIPTIPPTGASHYHLKMEDSRGQSAGNQFEDGESFKKAGKTVSLHLDGRCQKEGTEGVMFLSKHAPDFDMYTGRTVNIIGGKGLGQRTRILSYDPGMKRCKIEPWQAALPDKTTKYTIIESEFDEKLLQIEKKLVKNEMKCREIAVMDEKERKNKIRRRMWAAVRMHMMASREGAKLEEQRMKNAAEAWAAVNDENEVEDDGNVHMVNGKPMKCTWRSIILDSEPAFQEIEVMPTDDECPAVLHVKVCQARDLLAADSNGSSDPYVRIQIGDDIENAVQTKHLNKTLDPVWNETFNLYVSRENRAKTVTFEVFDRDMIGQDDSLGKFSIGLPSLKIHDEPSGANAFQLLHSTWHTFDPVPKTHPADPDNIGEMELQYELVKAKKADDDGEAPETTMVPRPGHMSWKGYVYKVPLYSTVELNEDKSVKQPILILNADTGQQLFKGNMSHWKVWQSLLEEGEQLDDRDDVFQWRGRLIMQPFTTIDDTGHDNYTVVDNDSGRILYSGPDLEPTQQDLEEEEKYYHEHPGEHDASLHSKLKEDQEREDLKTAQESERQAATKSLASQKEAAQLKLTIVSAKDLIASDRGGTSDPYCVIHVSMGHNDQPFYENMTSTKAKNLNPEYHETFDIHLNSTQRQSILSIEVFDKDNFDEDDSLGHVEIPLHHLQPMKQQDTWYKLLNDRVKGQPENNGQLHLMCKLIPKLPPAVLQIEILRAKDLIAADAGGTSDPYVRVHVGDEIGDAVKTSVKKKTLAPEWNERLSIKVRSDQRRDYVTFECFDYDAMSSDDSLGLFRISLDDVVPAEKYQQWHTFERTQGVIEVRYALLPVLGPAILDVQVLRARKLIAADRGGTSDPYVKMHVGEDIKKAVMTTVQKKTLEPEWHEKFSFRLESDQRRQLLYLECFDKDLLDSDDSLGRCTLDLGELINRQQYSEWLKLNNVAEGVAPFANEGEIELRYKLQETKEGEDASVVAQRIADLPKHDVGGQEWENVQDPLLWQSLLEESVSIPGDEETFSWRGIICYQPERDGPNQLIESMAGAVIFHGPDPNEATDFPSELEQEDMMRTRILESKGKISKVAIETEDGKYEGGMRQGQMQGEGMFMWNDGMIYSGQYVDNLREGTGTEIFPAYDNTETDENEEVRFPYYEGQMLHGMRHGKGVYYYSNGDLYTGMWKFNLPDGQGTYLWVDGDYLESTWRAGLPLKKVFKTQKARPGTAASELSEIEEELKKGKKKKKNKKTKEKEDDGDWGFQTNAEARRKTAPATGDSKKTK